jgi:hypothetical protein
VGGYDEEANRFLDAAGLVAWIEAERGPEVTRLHLLDGAAERSWRRWHHTRTARLEAVDRVLVLLDLELALLPEANPLEPNRLSNGPPPDSAVVPRFRYRIEGVEGRVPNATNSSDAGDLGDAGGGGVRRGEAEEGEGRYGRSDRRLRRR